jgi:hypothetical protein
VNPDKFSDLDKRNQFIYDLAKDKKLSWEEVSQKMREHFDAVFKKEGRKKFNTVLNAKATAQAARDHRKKFTLDPLPTRDSGRKPGSAPKSKDE